MLMYPHTPPTHTTTLCHHCYRLRYNQAKWPPVLTTGTKKGSLSLGTRRPPSMADNGMIPKTRSPQQGGCQGTVPVTDRKRKRERSAPVCSLYRKHKGRSGRVLSYVESSDSRLSETQSYRVEKSMGMLLMHHNNYYFLRASVRPFAL